MGTDAIASRRLARRASARDLRRRVVRDVGLGLLYGAGVSLVLACVSRGTGAAWPMPIVLAGPPIVLAFAATVLAWTRRWDEPRAAIELDRALGLRDRLSSAITLSRAPRGDPAFIELAVRDAERVAAGANANAIGRVRWGWTWAAWPLVLGAAAAALTFFPRLGTNGRDRREALSPEIASSAEAITSTAELIRAGEPELAANPGALDELEALEAELRAEGADPGQASARAARIADETASRAAERSRHEAEASDQARRLLADAARGSSEPGTPSELREALQGADLDAACDAAKALRVRALGMTPEERAKLAEELRTLATAIQASQAGNPESPSTESSRNPNLDQPAHGAQTGESAASHDTTFEPSAELSRELAEQGLTAEDIEHIAQSQNADEARESLNREGVTPAAAAELAERLTQEQRDARAHDRAREDTSAVAEAMHQAADELERPVEEPSKVPNPQPAARPGEPSGGTPSKPTPTNEAHGAQSPSPDASKPRDAKPADAKPGESNPGASKPGTPRPSGGEGHDRPSPGQPQQPRQQPVPEQQPSGEQPSQGQPGVRRPEPTSGNPDPAKPGANELPGTEATRPDGTQVPNSTSPDNRTQPSREPASSTPAPGGKGTDPAPQPPGAQEQTAGESATPPAREKPSPGQADPLRSSEPRRPGDSPRPAPGQSPGTPEPGAPNPDSARSQAPDQAPGASESGESSDDGEFGEGASEPGDGLGRLEKRLERIADRDRRAERLARDSRALEEQARKLWDRASPAERKQIEDWARAFDEERPSAIDPEFARRAQDPFDVRPDDAPSGSDHVTGEIEADRSRSETPAWRADPLAQAKQAAASAERAVENQAVPRDRGDLVRRVFKRFAQRTTVPAPPNPEGAPPR